MKTENLTSSFLALRDKLHRSALRFLKNDEDARDVLQDTFFNLWRDGGAESESEARNKLFAVLRNICIDRLRKPKTYSLDEADTERLVVKACFFEDMDKYESLLTAGLTDIQRHIYSLVTNDGMEYEAIAETLDISVDAVRMNMSRARKKIRDNCWQNCGEIHNRRTPSGDAGRGNRPAVEESTVFRNRKDRTAHHATCKVCSLHECGLHKHNHTQ